MNTGEIIIALGNLEYTLGASIDGYKGKGPGIEKLKELYYSSPSVGVAMMLNGITVTSWYEGLKQKEET